MKYAPAIVSIFLLFAFSVIYDELVISVISFFVSYLIIILYEKERSFLNPNIMYLGFFIIYSSFYSLKILLVNTSILPINYGLLTTSLHYSFFGMNCFYLFFSLFRRTKCCSEKVYFYESISEFLRSKKTSFDIIYYTSLLFTVMFILLLLGSGASNKIEFQNATGGMGHALNYFGYFIIACVIIRQVVAFKEKKVDLKVLLAIICMSFSFLFTGERDLLFRLGFILFIIYTDYQRNISIFFIIVFLVAVSLLVPFSQSFKSVLLKGELNLSTLSLNLLFSNEFLSAGRNLYSLVLYNADAKISTIINEILRGMLPGSLMNVDDFKSLSYWFHVEYRVNNGFSGVSGWGFSLIGVGAIFAGYFGVMLIMLLVAVVLAFFYNRVYINPYYFIFYVNALMASIYCTRADLANYISQVLKMNSLIILCFLVLTTLLLKLNKR